MNWNQLEIFKGIDLNDSFVLSWQKVGDNLLIELEASIWPESKHYRSPNEDEYTCYRKATLEFVGFNELEGLIPVSCAASTTDIDGSVDFGNIDILIEEKGNFHLSGNFGEVTVFGGELNFAVHI